MSLIVKEKQSKHGTGGRMMTPKEINRIENAIRHIQTAADVDPWAAEIAVDALEKQQPMETGPDELGISVRNPVITPCKNCGMELADRMWSYCPWCGQKIKWRKR